MSNIKIRRALEIAVDGLSPTIETAWENTTFNPTKGTPYQEVNVLFATPFNPSVGSSNSTLVEQRGFLQISLLYPLRGGTLSIDTRVELIKATFKRGVSFSNLGQTVIIRNTAEVMPGLRDGDRWRVVVKINFYSHEFV